MKAPVVHKPPTGALSQTPFLISTVPSGQAGPDRKQNTTTSSVDMISPLENLYQETDPEPVFAQLVSAGPASATYEHGPASGTCPEDYSTGSS